MTHTIAVLGSGSWGTALAVHLARTGHDVRLWARDAGLAADVGNALAGAETLKHMPARQVVVAKIHERRSSTVQIRLPVHTQMVQSRPL